MRLAAVVLFCLALLAVLFATLDEGRESLRDPAYWIEQTKKTDPAVFIEQLDHEDPFRRRRAIQSLAIVGPKTEAVVPALIRMLEDEDAAVRKDAAASLASMAEAAVPDAVEPIIARLGDPDFEVQGAAAFALSRLATHQREGLREPLIRAIQRENRTVRIHAAYGLGQLAGDDEALAALVEALGDDEQPAGVDVREALAEAIALHGERAIAFLELALEEPTRRLGAIEALEHFGSKARALGDRIAEMLDDAEDDPELQRSIARTIASTGADPELALPRLRKLLVSDRTSVQMAAASAIASLGAPALPMLKEMIDARGAELEGALRAAADVECGDAELEASLLEVLTDTGRKSDLRRLAARAVGKLAVTPKDSVAALLPFVNDPTDPDLRYTATRALGDFGPRAVGAIPSLVGSLQSDPDATQRQMAARALGRICRPTEGEPNVLATRLGIPALRERLEKEPNESVRRAIEQALRSIADG